MIKTLNPYVISDKNRERLDWADWRFNSHYWIEILEGVFECKFCERQHTSQTGIDETFPLCNMNPYLKELD